MRVIFNYLLSRCGGIECTIILSLQASARRMPRSPHHLGLVAVDSGVACIWRCLAGQRESACPRV